MLRTSRMADLLTQKTARFEPFAPLGKGVRVVGGPVLGGLGKLTGGLGMLVRKFPVLPIAALWGGSAAAEAIPRVRHGMSAASMNARLFGRPGPYIPGL